MINLSRSLLIVALAICSSRSSAQQYSINNHDSLVRFSIHKYIVWKKSRMGNDYLERFYSQTTQNTYQTDRILISLGFKEFKRKGSTLKEVSNCVELLGLYLCEDGLCYQISIWGDLKTKGKWFRTYFGTFRVYFEYDSASKGLVYKNHDYISY